MFSILTYLPAKRKTTPSGWHSFNAVCCQHNGDTQDRRRRGGIILKNQDWSYHCFNCGFKTSFVMGRALTFKATRLLSWLGVPQQEIDGISLASLQHRSIAGMIQARHNAAESHSIKFKHKQLPPESYLVEDNTPAWRYLQHRAMPTDYPFLTVRDSTRDNVVIPFTQGDQMVGHTQRFLDSRQPRYITDSQPGYVFGLDLQQDTWQHVLVVEGVFDALSISGVAVLHNSINDAQALQIRQLARDIVVVPDHDAAGLALVERAVELGWAVSMPAWPTDIKDANDAVRRYGRLGTLLMIMQARETSRIKIEIRRKNLDKRLRS